jgi:hypothetical protein
VRVRFGSGCARLGSLDGLVRCNRLIGQGFSSVGIKRKAAWGNSNRMSWIADRVLHAETRDAQDDAAPKLGTLVSGRGNPPVFALASQDEASSRRGTLVPGRGNPPVVALAAPRPLPDRNTSSPHPSSRTAWRACPERSRMGTARFPEHPSPIYHPPPNPLP